MVRQMRPNGWLLLGSLAVCAGGSAWAVDVPITATKLIVVDKLASSFRAKAVFVSRDPAITKGTGTDPLQISAQLDVAYDATRGAFDMPPFDRAPVGEWAANDAAVAKYLFPIAPTDGAVRIGVIKPGVALKMTAKSLGDVPIDLSAAPSGSVYTSVRIANGGEQFRLCTEFPECTHQPIAAGTGYKLVCRGNAVGDAACLAARPSCFTDDGATVLDTCRGLEWERKDTAIGSGQDGANLHDVDNRYQWTGVCLGPSGNVLENARCQPNALAATTCTAHTGGANGCAECAPANGPCVLSVAGQGTVWEWLNQLNAAAFAGHADWRLPQAGSPREMESILDFGFTPRIDPVFGPTVAGVPYWTANWSNIFPTQGNFATGRLVQAFESISTVHARAVRTTPPPP